MLKRSKREQRTTNVPHLEGVGPSGLDMQRERRVTAITPAIIVAEGTATATPLALPQPRGMTEITAESRRRKEEALAKAAQEDRTANQNTERD